jgi:hypothetical protein
MADDQREGQVRNANAGPRRIKPKGAPHAIDYDVLDDPTILAAPGWEEVKEEYWSAAQCREYVKLNHIGKLWPREQLPQMAKTFTAKPSLCRDDHFLHRAEEVWRALFGARSKSKGTFNYNILAMVYAELRLERKVDWSTYPATKSMPTQLTDG